MTVLEVIQRGTEFLTRKGVDAPRLQVELLLAHALRLPRLDLYLKSERALTEPELEELRAMVKRRGDREPLQHIIGSTSFCGLELAVNREVLVPRPETELLAERAWQQLQQFAAARQTPPTALDFGTGSGCLAIAMAVRCPQAAVYALDISPSALAVARQNAARHQLDDRIQFIEGDGLQALPPGTQLDLLVSNPPYIPTAVIDTLEPEVKNHDPRAALDGGPDGLDCFRRLAIQAPPFFAPGGTLLLEIGDGQEMPLREVFAGNGWRVREVAQDYSARPRILIAEWRETTLNQAS